MKWLMHLMLLSLYMCGPVFSGARDVQTLVEAELNQMLSNEEAFPEGSIQHEELLQLSKNLSRWLGYRKNPQASQSKPNVSPNPHADHITSTLSKPTSSTAQSQLSKPASSSVQSSPSKPASNSGQSEPFKQASSPVQSSPPKPGMPTRHSFDEVMDRKSSLDAELIEVNRQHEELQKYYNDLLAQGEQLRKYSSALQSDGQSKDGQNSNRERYQEALKSYRETEQTHNKLKQDYKTAYERYNESRRSYGTMLDAYNSRNPTR